MKKPIYNKRKSVAEWIEENREKRKEEYRKTKVKDLIATNMNSHMAMKALRNFYILLLMIIVMNMFWFLMNTRTKLSFGLINLKSILLY